MAALNQLFYYNVSGRRDLFTVLSFDLHNDNKYFANDHARKRHLCLVMNNKIIIIII
jgi:hypothetical protein